MRIAPSSGPGPLSAYFSFQLHTWTPCPSKNCRVMDSLLAKLHRALAAQARLANTGAIMSLYLHDLSHQMQDGPGGSGMDGASDSFLIPLFGYERAGRDCW